MLPCVDTKSIRNLSLVFFFKSRSLKIFFRPHTFSEVSVTIVPRQSLRQRYERLNFSLACALFDPCLAGFGRVKERGLKNEQELEEFCACKLLKFGRLLGEGLKFSERKKI